MSNAVPTFDASSNTITLPSVEGVVYTVGGQPVENSLEIKRPTTVRVRAKQGFVLHPSVQKDHVFKPEKAEASQPEEKDEAPAKDADPIPTEEEDSTESPASVFGRSSRS